MLRTVCPKCKHLYGREGVENHECPTEVYNKAKRILMEGALLAEETFSRDELERFASGWRREHGR